MRVVLAIVALAGCASAGQPSIGGDDTGGDDAPPTDAKGAVTPDACGDDDGDTVCNVADKCPGHNDAVDADTDTVADGCDRCPGVDDRPDLNANQMPDCLEYVTRTITLKSVGTNLWRGWHSSSAAIGHTSTNDNTITGDSAGTLYNSYFVFSLTGFTATAINSLTLQLQLEMYTSGDATETFSVWDVTAAGTTVENTGSDINLHNDLMTGVQYGTLQTTAGAVNTLLSIPLSAMAATHASAKLVAADKDFVVGVHLDTAPGWIRFGHTGTGATPTTIQLVVKYLP